MIFSKIPAQSRRQFRRPMDRRAIMMLMLEDLESRVLLAGTATQLIFTVPPSQTAVGTPMFPAVQVTVADATGATVTTDNSRVNMILVSNPVGGSLTQSGVVVLNATANAVNGVATFANVSFNMVGQYSVAVNDGGLLGVVSNTFNVTAAAAKLVFSQPPLNIGAGLPFSPAITVFVEDANGNLVTTDRSAIALSVQTGPSGGSLNGVTTINAINGVATFSGVAVNKPGTYTLAAKEQTTPVTLTPVISNSFVVSAGAPAKLVFQQQPVNTPQGTQLAPIIIDVTDSGGNIVTTDNSAVTLILPGTTGALAGTTTVNAVNGVATFADLSIAQLGSYTLQASDGTLTPVTSHNFAVTGPGVQLAFQQRPVQTTAGQVMTPGIAVVVEDANGNVVTNDTSSMTIAIATGSGSISGTTTVHVINGVATFSNLAFSQLGNYTVTVTDSLLTNPTSSLTSGSFLINGTASQLVFVGQPTQTAAGTPILPPVTVQVEDSAGNIVLNDTSSVTIAVGTGSGGVVSGTTNVPVVNGLATFSNLMLSLQGTYTLTASDGSLHGATSNSVVILPPPHLGIVTQPSNVARGSVMFPSVVVQIFNADGTPSTANTTSVTLTITGGPRNGSMSGTTTVAAVAGVATFSTLSFSVSGRYTLVASDGSLATALSNRFTVTAPAAKLQWSAEPASTVTAGSTGSWMPTVSVWTEDRNGDPVPDHAVLTLAISTGPAGATIVGSATASAVGGVARFSTVALPKAGSYVLNVTSTGLTAAKSKKFNVVPDKATEHLLVLKSPVSTVVGRAFSPVVVVVADQLGNIITSNQSAITMAISSGPGGTLHGTKTVHAHNGVAKFSNLSIDMAGSYVLSASVLSLSLLTTYATVISPVTTLALKPTASSSNFAVGQAFTVKETLKGLIGSPVPWTGTAALFDSANHKLTPDTPVSAGGKVTLAVPSQTMAGTEVVHVVYSGDINHLGAASPALTLTVGPATTTRVTGAPRQITSGTALALDVQVNAGNHAALVPTGTVQLIENGAVIATQSLNGSSHATISLTPPAVGSHAYTVVYEGDPNFRSSVSPVLNVTVT